VPKALDRFLKRLRELRKLHELTQEQFSEVSQISYKYYQALEAGRKSEVRLSTVERVARVYGLEVHELLAPVTPQSRLTRRASPRTRRKR
jgi:transcriptional regulator with XRE-family HTH domain